MDNRSAWKMAYALGWPSFWPTVLYGAIVITPFAVLIMFSGEANLPFAFAVFFFVLGFLFWKFLRGYLDDGMRLAPELFGTGVLPLVLGKIPTPERLKNGKAVRKATWEMLRERFTAFSFAALLGSVIVSVTHMPVLVVLYLPLWLLIDVYFFGQLLQRKKKKPAAPDISPKMLEDFMAFDRWQGAGFWRPFNFAFLYPALLFAVLWVAYPLAGGAITLQQSEEVTAFFSDVKEPEADKNGVFAILGLGAKEGDIHKAGLAVAAEIESGVRVAPLAAVLPDGAAPLCHTETPPPEGQKCLKLSQAGGALAANRELLDRYEQLYRYETFVWPKALAAAKVMDYEEAYLGGLVDLGMLKIVSYTLQAQKGNPEAALKEWLYHTGFLAKLMEGRNSLRAYANHKYVYAEAMSVLPYILGKGPGLAKKYHEGIRKAFAYLGPRDVDMIGVIRNDMSLMAWSVDRQVATALGSLEGFAPKNVPAFLKSAAAISFGGSTVVLERKIYWLMREMEQLVNGDRSDIEEVRKLMANTARRYSTRNGRLLHGVSDLTKPHIGALTNLLLSPIPAAFGNVLFDVPDYDRQRMRLAYLEAAQRGIAPDGMNDFLKDKAAGIDPQLAEFESHAPFYWEAAAGKICYDEKPAPESKTPPPREKITHCLETKPFVE